MTPLTQTRTQKEGATEVGTLSLATHSSVSTSGDAVESSAPRESLEVRVRRFLDGLRARNTEETSLDRYRRAQEEGEDVLCKSCHEYPAAWCGRCFACNADRRLPA